jgi:hypothetical protein
MSKSSREAAGATTAAAAAAAEDDDDDEPRRGAEKKADVKKESKKPRLGIYLENGWGGGARFPSRGRNTHVRKKNSKKPYLLSPVGVYPSVAAAPATPMQSTKTSSVVDDCATCCVLSTWPPGVSGNTRATVCIEFCPQNVPAAKGPTVKDHVHVWGPVRKVPPSVAVAGRAPEPLMAIGA